VKKSDPGIRTRIGSSGRGPSTVKRIAGTSGTKIPEGEGGEGGKSSIASGTRGGNIE